MALVHVRGWTLAEEVWCPTTDSAVLAGACLPRGQRKTATMNKKPSPAAAMMTKTEVMSSTYSFTSPSGECFPYCRNKCDEVALGQGNAAQLITHDARKSCGRHLLRSVNCLQAGAVREGWAGRRESRDASHLPFHS